MNKKHGFFIGFVVLMVAAIFMFSGCPEGPEGPAGKDGSGFPEPGQSYKWMTNNNWKSNTANKKRFVIDYQYNMLVNDPANTYLAYWVEDRDGNKKSVVDTLDPTHIMGSTAQHNPQTGASSYSTTPLLNSFAGAGLGLGSLRSILLYAVCPYWYKWSEGFTVTKGPGKKLTFTLTHSTSTRVIETDANGKFTKDGGQQWQLSNMVMVWPVGEMNALGDEMKLRYWPFPDYTPHPIRSKNANWITVTVPGRSAAAPLAAGAAGVAPTGYNTTGAPFTSFTATEDCMIANPNSMGIWDKANIDYSLIKKYDAAPTLAIPAFNNASGEKFVGEVLLDYNEKTGLLTVRADLLIQDAPL